MSEEHPQVWEVIEWNAANFQLRAELYAKETDARAVSEDWERTKRGGGWVQVVPRRVWGTSNLQ